MNALNYVQEKKMIQNNGNMWQNYGVANHKLLITTNSFVKSNGELVMGRGIAYEAKDKFPDLPRKCGETILGLNAHLKFYGVVMINETLGIFQVKYNWSDNALLKLIEGSTIMLDKLARTNNKLTFNLNFPGIGNGHLNYNQVFPIVKRLPDNVILWQYGKDKVQMKVVEKEPGEKLFKELFE